MNETFSVSMLQLISFIQSFSLVSVDDNVNVSYLKQLRNVTSIHIKDVAMSVR